MVSPMINSCYDQSASFSTIVRLLYEPQFLHTLCGITSSPHVEQTARFGAVIFQLALLLSRLALDVLFLGHIDIAYTSLRSDKDLSKVVLYDFTSTSFICQQVSCLIRNKI